jgi:hypothetical protein
MDADGFTAGRCELCRRRVSLLTKHHLIPRMRHRSKRNRRTYDREEVRGRIALLCKPCHEQVHALLSEKELERTYNTLATLAAEPNVARFVAWIRRKPDGTSVSGPRPA